jgi:hypothetical protein
LEELIVEIEEITPPVVFKLHFSQNWKRRNKKNIKHTIGFDYMKTMKPSTESRRGRWFLFIYIRFEHRNIIIQIMISHSIPI